MSEQEKEQEKEQESEKELEKELEEKFEEKKPLEYIPLSEIVRWNAHAGLYLAKTHPDWIKESKKLYGKNEEINRKIGLFAANICHIECDAIQNSANGNLIPGGGGMNGEVHKNAGPELSEACLKIGRCDPGKTKITPAYHLPSKYILHSVGPDDQNLDLLKSAYQTALNYVSDKTFQIKSLALAALSTGTHSIPYEKATRVALSVVRDWLDVKDNLDNIDLVIFVMNSPQLFEVYERLMLEYFPI
ncbi:adp-ribose glycohydrolase macrod2 [Anaeramoeba ignava]|uniref:Adp-ribose glycohydrolase macrod2 n=1 Tax=Anaeramoeba ignava TaxID=1746090 RepID=A0A9Q0RFJ7_ANAIG|nr:adp-ribose glycohydrolase macrod2 [Anaeramoeba ignava]